MPPAPRTESDFDPGAKYHVAGNTPYARYFLAAILQFQFYRAMCKEAGYTGPSTSARSTAAKRPAQSSRRCSRRGEQPWPETLAGFTGESGLDASAIMEYFQPLKVWLDRQNAGKPVGW